ncbi:MAG TPA: TolC family protein [Phycisphaerales bacterium]|nr:TolC family protein [Phycisphaerales bacterium]
MEPSLSTSMSRMKIVRIVFVIPLLASGCRLGMGSIDRRIDRVLAERSGELSRTVEPPRRSWPDADSTDSPAQADKRIPTTNPAPDELTYVPADEARDAKARLDDLLDEQGEVLPLTLADTLRLSQTQSREYLSAQEQYIIAAIRLMIQRHTFDPRLFNTTTVSVAGAGSDASFTAVLNIMNELGVTKQFERGGQLAASWILNASEDLRTGATDRYTQSSELVLSGNFPLLRGAGSVASESLIQAERDLVYAARDFERFRRQLFVSIASDYIRLLQQHATIENQQRRIDSLQRLQDETRAKAEAGQLRDFEISIAQSDLLSAQAALAGLQDQYRLLEDRFKIRIGLPVDQRVTLAPILLSLPDPAVELDQATRAALDYRLDLQNTRDRVLDARRSVANARNALLPDLNIDARVGLPTDPDVDDAGVSFDPGELNYSAGATLQLPLDRLNERLQVRESVIQLEQQIRGYEQARDNVVIDARAAVRAVELARLQLTLAERQVETNRRRQRGQSIDRDTITPQEIVDTQNALLASENARDQARADLRIAILNYILSTGQMRVLPDGRIAPIGGLDLMPAEDQPDP